MEMLSILPNYISIYEPLHRVWYPESAESGFTPRTYIEPDTKSAEHRSYLEKVFKGRVVNRRPHFKFGDMPGRFEADRVLVKFVRGNRLLPWIINNFDLRGKILIIRNPCSNISSQIRTRVRGYFIPKETNLKLSVILNEAREIVSDKIYEELKEIRSDEGVLAASWALDQYVPLYYKKKFDFTLVSYERLMLDPEHEIERILRDIGYKSSLYDILSRIEEPSMTGQDCRSNKKEQLNKWKKYLSIKQIEEIMNVIKIFGMDFYDEGMIVDLKRMNDYCKKM